MTTITSRKPKNFSFIGFFRLIRFPNLLIIVFTQYMTAVFLVGKGEPALRYLLDFKLFLLTLSTALIAAAGYIINDYYDVKIDFINKPDQVVVGKILKRRVVMFSHTFLNFTGVLLGLFLGWKIFLINLFAAFLLWLYSNDLKRRPFVGNLSVAVLTALSVGVLGIYYREQDLIVLTYAFFAFGITLIREIIKDLEDMKGDAVHGCRTLPVIWGIRKTRKLLFILISAFLIALFLMAGLSGKTILTTYFLILLVPISLLLVKLFRADTQKVFAQLSFFCKLIILSGIISMIFF
ncbi:geranylgeranylglycerol-phosphate geranylgeranyltransferase [Xanthovirga aplysinae]|uniref:geranylgeranylglycerol-phosphate geranylgeranyltransferase n=1 Tax=Xanthovirga aplysinae TaxID=2529853 RepID=UPI0012BC5D37|nr:geranylgeranylglycerol-phosphate geranylgeranyltransferase [Xanthovirga aplysinae]MTI33630.1 prenyltransferase [Xanthovirga aplysinae]